jgi:hypothetical protein
VRYSRRWRFGLRGQSTTQRRRRTCLAALCRRALDIAGELQALDDAAGVKSVVVNTASEAWNRRSSDWGNTVKPKQQKPQKPRPNIVLDPLANLDQTLEGLGDEQIRANFEQILDEILDGRSTEAPTDVGFYANLSNKLAQLGWLVSRNAPEAAITAAVDAAKDALQQQLDGNDPDVWPWDPKIDEE